MHEVNFRQQRFGFAVTGNGRRRQRFQHAVAEGRRAAAAAGEEEDEQQAVVVVFGIQRRFQAVAATAVHMIKGGKRLILDERTGGEQERQQEDGEAAHGQAARWAKKRVAIGTLMTVSTTRKTAKAV